MSFEVAIYGLLKNFAVVFTVKNTTGIKVISTDWQISPSYDSLALMTAASFLNPARFKKI